MALLGSSLVFASACPGGGAVKPQPDVHQHGGGGGGDGVLTADGKHFAADRLYKGECVGGRGGCYSITLRADGTYSHMLLDAAMLGTYVIDGDQVQLTPDGDAPPQTMTLSADRMKLDDFVYEAAAAP